MPLATWQRMSLKNTREESGWPEVTVPHIKGCEYGRTELEEGGEVGMGLGCRVGIMFRNTGYKGEGRTAESCMTSRS